MTLGSIFPAYLHYRVFSINQAMLSTHPKITTVLEEVKIFGIFIYVWSQSSFRLVVLFRTEKWLC